MLKAPQRPRKNSLTGSQRLSDRGAQQRPRQVSSGWAPYRSIWISVLVAGTVWTVWLAALGPQSAVETLFTHWQVALTMVFGSMVAGGTSMGGGAVAFPVFTKVLHIHPHDAKVFALAIQSVGMSAASIAIVAMRTPVEWRFIRWASLGGVPGLLIGSLGLAPLLPAELIKLSFTMLTSSFGVVLFVLTQQPRQRNLTIPVWRASERQLAVLIGIVGGISSGLVGSGIDIVSFTVIVLLFRLCEKVSTPTSVILMAINAITGFVIHACFVGDFTEPVISYWLSAVPVVVIGAPLGAVLCHWMPRRLITHLLLALILLELVSSLMLLPLTRQTVGYSVALFLVFLWMYVGMAKNKRYIERSSHRLSPLPDD